jgi:hypothetical protein
MIRRTMAGAIVLSAVAWTLTACGGQQKDGAAAPLSSPSLAPSLAPSPSPTALTISGSVRLESGQYDEIYGGAQCWGGGDFYGKGDLRLMSLSDDPPVVVKSKAGKKLAEGTLSSGSPAGDSCDMQFELSDVPPGLGHYELVLGHECGDCPYPSQIAAQYTESELKDPVEVPLNWR